MTIVYFGDFDPNYARNKVIIDGLRLNGIEVVLCNDRSRGRRKYLQLARMYRQLPTHDAIIVGHSDNRWMTPLVKLFSRKKIVWDGFYSIYDSWVFDRKLVLPNSLKARYYWCMDWLNCRLADAIITDTQQHINYFVTTFKANPLKFSRVFVGTNNLLFHP